MRFGNPKKIHRKVNAIIRKINKSIEKDELWKGRFYIREKEYHQYKFEDNSGYILYLRYRYYDKITGESKDFWFDSCDVQFPSNDFLWSMNDFIIDLRERYGF